MGTVEKLCGALQRRAIHTNQMCFPGLCGLLSAAPACPLTPAGQSIGVLLHRVTGPQINGDGNTVLCHLAQKSL